FIPTTDRFLFGAVSHYLKRCDAGTAPTFHLIIMYEQAAWMTGGYPYAKMLRYLRNNTQLGEQIFVYTETKRHAERLSAALKIPVACYPYPSIPLDDNKRNSASGECVRVGVVGGGRRDKGFHRLPEIVRGFNELHRGGRKVSFVIQKPRAQDCLEDHVQDLGRISNVVLLDNQVSQDEYKENLRSYDALLFPYDQNVYGVRGSGAISEALAYGKPFVCTSGTSLEEGITHGNGIAAPTTEKFAIAIGRVVTDIHRYKAEAAHAARAYANRLYNNPVVRNMNRSFDRDAVVSSDAP
ncbi:MAG: glycosyltransferase, partial [Gammaproteobacteria bacterium]|nr:glycosyltransferase [Gammaproteobacteria bacterium]